MLKKKKNKKNLYNVFHKMGEVYGEKRDVYKSLQPEDQGTQIKLSWR